MSCPYKPASAAPAVADVPKCPYSAPAEPQRCPYAGNDAPAKQQHCPYDDTEANRDWANATGEEFKAHFEKTYDRVAAKTEATEKPSADRLERARRQAIRCGYTEAELAVIGDDTWLLQGTGNPHKLAKVVDGETVVDLGSGLGIDAIVAASKVGSRGRVIGVDLSSREILSALTRVRARGLRNLDFRLGDIEAPPIDDGIVDVVLSNGGFCLVPDKKKAFAEIFRMLRPGGASRMAISCTVRLAELESGKRWPSCFLVFMPMEDVHPVLAACGFVDIVVERCPEEEKEEKQEKALAEGEIKPTATCHSTGNPDYAFLRDYDMNALFARVNIYARKP